MACGSLVPWPGIEPVSLQYKCWVLTTEPPGQGPVRWFYTFVIELGFLVTVYCPSWDLLTFQVM